MCTLLTNSLTLPAKPKRNFPQKKILVGCGIAGIGVIISVVIFSAFPSSTTYNEYSILVDPTKEQQSLFIIARVLIQNTSS
jgi:amino acid transporter